MTPREWIVSVWRRGRALWRRRQLERDVEDEVRFHLDLREADYRARGLDRDESRRAARLRFGNPAALTEACRDVWTFAPVETLARDVRFALRVLWRSRGFTAVAVGSLALGIGANTAMFSLVNAVLLQPLPYPEAGRLVRLTGFYPKGAVAALQEQSRSLDAAGVSAETEFNLTGHGEALRVGGSAVSANFFEVLGREPALGRAFAAGDDRPGRDGLVVLGDSLWRSRFRADPTVLGRTVSVDGVDRRVVGVMPPGFHFPSVSTALWVPLRMDPARTEDYWGFGWMPVVARMRAGVTPAQADGELRAMVARITGLFPWPAPDWNAGASVVALQEDLARNLRRKLLVLQAAVGLVLLIACANVASLLLARASVRRKEVALRAALGAGRARIVRQLLTESVTLAALGGLAGAGLAWLLVGSVQALLPSESRGFAPVHVDGGVLAAVSALAVLCGLTFGVAPALGAVRGDLSREVKAGGRRTSVPAGSRLRAAFVAAEVALAVVLAIGAGLLIRTLQGLTRADAGFRAERILTTRVSPNPAACTLRPACIALYDELLRGVRGLGGVAEAVAASAQPLGGEQPLLPVEMEGHPLVAGQGRVPLLWAGAVTPGYFRLLRIPVLQGRDFEDRDGEESARVVVVSASTARRYWPGEDPIGKRIRVVWDREWRTVVGVAGDVRQYALSGRAPADITGAMYMPYPQAVGLDRQIPRVMALFLRATSDPAEIAARLRPLVAGLDPEVPVSEVRRLEAVRDAAIGEPRTMMWLFAGFAACALLLATLGTYGVVSYTAAQRTYEIGVRLALGATRGQILRLVVGQSVRLVSIGAAAGLLAALALGRSLSSFLYGVSAHDPATFAGVVVLLVITAAVAGGVPGQRAAATDPVRALRAD